MTNGDPELDQIIAELAAVFRARTVAEMPLIESHWATLQAGAAPREAAEALRQIVHRIAGSAGSFGFAELGAVAVPLDDALAFGLEGNDALLADAAREWAPLVEALLAAIRAL